MNTPLVTVVTPCLNPGERLQRCLESVAAQTYPHVEHIVMDGGSTDATVDLLRESDVRWESRPDSGQSEAINRGFAQATGSILTWLNADDALRPSAVETVVAYLTGHPDVDLLVGAAEVVAGDRRTIMPSSGRLGIEQFDLHTPIAQPACFFRSETWRRCGPLDEQLHLAMDLDFWYRCLRAGQTFVAVPDVLAEIEFHEDAKTFSVPRFDWEVEYARVRIRHRRPKAAAVNIGRAIAQMSSPSVADRSRRLAGELERVAAEQPLEVVAGMKLEKFAMGDDIARLRHLAHPAVWRVSPTRRALLASLRRRLVR